MIKGIYPGGRYTQVNNGTPPWPSIYNTNSGYSNNGSSFAGQVRYNSQGGGLEIFDGNNWQRIGDSIAQVSLTQEAEALLDWAREKRNEDLDLKARMEKYPGLKDAYEKFKVMDVLTLELDFGEVQSSP